MTDSMPAPDSNNTMGGGGVMDKSPSPDTAQSMMSSGSVMTLYTKSNTGTGDEITSRHVYIWWEHGPKLGCIYWNDEIEAKDQSKKVEGQSLMMKQIADVFSGKQTAVMRHPSLSSLPSDCCFSLGSKGGALVLDLNAGSRAVKQGWMRGIRAIFAEGAAAKKRAKALTMQQQLQQAESRKAQREEKERAAQDAQGHRAGSVEAKSGETKNPPPTATIGEGEPNKTEETETKQTAAELATTATTKAESQQPTQKTESVPAVGHDTVKQSNETGSDTTISAGITPASSPSTVTPAQTSSSSSTSSPATSTTHPTPVSTSVASSSKISSMVSGCRFQSFDRAGEAGVPTFVWLDPNASKFGVIYTKKIEGEEEGQPDQPRVGDERHALHMHRVSDVYLGRRAREFSAAKDLPSNVCFSLVSKGRSLHLAAPNEHVRTIWLDGIKEIFALQKAAAAKKKAEKQQQQRKAGEGAAAAAAATVANGATSKEHTANGEPAATAPASTSPTPSVAASTPSSPPASATTSVPTSSPPSSSPSSSSSSTSLLGHGHMYDRVFILPSNDPTQVPSVVRRPIFLFHEADSKLGTLYWNEKAGDRTKKSERSLPVAKIRDVWVGKQCAEFRSDSLKDVPSNTCFSLVLKDKVTGLHLIASDVATRDATLANVRGFWPKEKKREKTEPAGTLATTASSAAPAASATPAATGGETVPASSAAVPTTAAISPAASTASTQSNGPTSAIITPTKTGPTQKSSSPSRHASSPSSATLLASSDPHVNIQAMSTGSTFISYNLIPNNTEQPDSTKIFAWYAKDDPSPNADGMIGSIYWTPIDDSSDSAQGGNLSERKKKDPSRRLPLASITDIELGLRAWKRVNARPPASIFEQQLFTLITSTGLSMTLAAQDEKTRAMWVTGIRNAFELMAQQKKRDDEERRSRRTASTTGTLKPSPTAAATSPSPKHQQPQPEPSPAQQQAATPQPTPSPVSFIPSTAEEHAAVDYLSSGSVFTSYVLTPAGTVASGPLFVFYDPVDRKAGTIYWCKAGAREKVVGQSMPLHQLQDIYLGAHPQFKDRQEFSHIRSSNLVTIASRTVSATLEAPSAEQRNKFVDCIKTILKASGRKIGEARPAPQLSTSTSPATRSHGVMHPDGSGVSTVSLPTVPTSPRPSSQGTSGAVSPSALTQEKPLPTVAMAIAEGQDFDVISFDQTGSHIRQVPVHVWYEREKHPGSPGTLYWHEGSGEVARRQHGAHMLPLTDVTDVIIGKFTEEFRHPDSAHIPADRCISLRSSTDIRYNLNLVAPSPQVQRRWTRGLRKVFMDASDVIVETRAVKAGDLPAEAIAPPNSGVHNAAKLNSLAKGHVLSSVETAADGTFATRPVLLWYDPNDGRAGTLYWSHDDRGRARTKDPSRSIPIHSLSDIYVGKKIGPFKHEQFKHAPSARALSIANRRRTFNGITTTPDERTIILAELEAAVRVAGTPIHEYTGVPRAAATVAENVPLHSMVAPIIKGAIVLRHHTEGQNPTPIYLWFDPNVGKQGALYWSEKMEAEEAKKDKNTGRCLMLQHVSFIKLGKQAALLRSAPNSSCRTDNCFSLHSLNGPILAVQCSSRDERDEWLRCFRAMFLASRKKVVDQIWRGDLRRLHVGEKVDTFVGRGMVLEETRDDGITCVDVAGTRCYLNRQSIKVVPMVQTPFGPGYIVEKEGEAARSDGIKCVELPFGTAYLNAESIQPIKPVKSDPMRSVRSAADVSAIAALSPSPSPTSSPRPDIPSIQQAKYFLAGGNTFSLLLVHGDGRRIVREVNLFLDVVSDVLYWSPVDEPLKAHPDQALDVRDITEIWLNKRTALFAEKPFQHIEHGRCASIGVRDGSIWNLVADSRLRRDRFIACLQVYLQHGARASNLVGASRRWSQTLAQADNIASRGVWWIRWFGDESNPQTEHVFLFHESDGSTYGSLYWNNTHEGDRTRCAERVLPLSAVKDVFLGRSTPMMRSDALAPVSKSLLVTLQAPVGSDKDIPPFSLYLQATSKDERTEWIDALKSLWSRPSVSSGDEEGCDELPPLNVKHLDVQIHGEPISGEFLKKILAGKHRSLLLAPGAAVHFLQTGSRFVRNDVDAVDVYYVAAPSSSSSSAADAAPFGSLVVSRAGAQSIVRSDSRLDIHKIERIVTPDARTLQIDTAETVTLLTAESPLIVSAWLQGLNYILTAAAFRLTVSDDGRTFTINDPKALNEPTASLLAPLDPNVLAGTVFNGLFPSFSRGRRTVDRNPLMVFVSKMAIYFCSPLQRVQVDDGEHSIPFNQLRRVLIGRDGATTVTLFTDETQLNLEAPSQESLSHWLNNVSVLLRMAGYTIEVDEATLESSTKRAYVITRHRVQRGPTQSLTLPSASPPAPIVDTEAERSAMENFTQNGGDFTSVSLHDDGSLKHEPVHVSLSHDESEDAWMLHWSASPSPSDTSGAPSGSNHCLALDDLLTIQIGKVTPALQALTDRSSTVIPQQCVAITSKKVDKPINLIANSPAEASAIVKLIKSHNPKGLLV